jgi:hypothetical protein
MKNIIEELKKNWLILLLSLIFFALAAGMNAVMDTLTHHFSISIFAGLNDQYWNPAISWTNKNTYSFPLNIVQISDAWHLFKTLMLITIIYNFIFTGRRVVITWGRLIIYTILYGLAWNLSFDLFYDIILIIK